MRRALALAAALAMVVTAVLVRRAIDDDGGGGRNDGTLTVACPAELAEACAALGPAVEVRVQPPTATLAALASGDAVDELDAWFTTNAWLEVLESRTDDVVVSVQVVASTQPVLAVDPDRADAIEGLCAPTTTWQCLGTHAGQPWGSLGGDPRWGALRTGVPAAGTAAGLGVLASSAAGYFAGTDFAANDFDPAFDTWLGDLAGGRSDPDPLATLVTRPGTYSAAAGTEARAATIARPLTVRPLDPPVTIQAVLIGIGGDPVPDPGGAAQVLGGAGWAPADGDDPVVRLLKPGVLAALLTRWTEVVG